MADDTRRLTKGQLAVELFRIRAAYSLTCGDRDIMDEAISVLQASHAASLLGKRTSARKKASSQINGRLGGRPRKKKG